LSYLQDLIREFEEIVRQHEMEKIKTVGDAIMATAGLFTHVPDPLFAALRCGLDMVLASRRIEPRWQVRVGVQFGSVVAGLIGHRQYMFDLCGDTVNTAVRFASHANPGTVVTSGTTWLRIGDRARGRSMGIVEIKGKGPIELVECQQLT
jgi:class 3 adenylate cyclase